MKKWLIFFCVFFLIHGILFGAGSKEIDPVFTGNPESKYRFLMLVEISDFRFALANSIREKLTGVSDIFLTIDDLASFKNYTIDDYSAVVILNAGKMLKIDSKAQQIISSSAGKNIILVTTWGGKGPKNLDIDVDSITAASSMTDIDEVTNKVMTLLKKYY